MTSDATSNTASPRLPGPPWRSSRRAWWVLFLAALAIVMLWPPAQDKSLALKLTNWVVDPTNALPVLPPQLGPGLSDDPAAVEARDAVVRAYDELYDQSRWMRARLELKVARDPFTASTTRQVLLVAGVMIAFLVWRRGWSGP